MEVKIIGKYSENRLNSLESKKFKRLMGVDKKAFDKAVKVVKKLMMNVIKKVVSQVFLHVMKK